MPLDTFYLPKESISYINYPVLREQQANIEAILMYALRVHSALSDYNENTANRIDLNVDELREYIDLCRKTCAAMGTAERVPFDVLIEIRNIMADLMKLHYKYSVFGSSMFGTPTNLTTSEGSGV